MFSSSMGYIGMLLSIIVGSFIIGIPFASYLIPLEKNQKDEKFYLFIYSSTLVGFCITHLLIFWATQLFHSGTNLVALPVVGLLVVASLIFWMRSDAARIRVHYKDHLIPLCIFTFLLLFSTVHIMYPLVAGIWEMAYATGDDASRWYMVVNYFQTHPFEYLKNTEETLIWGMRERPLQNISGAIIASLLKAKASIAYSLSSSSAMVMATLAFCLLFEGIFTIYSKNSRYTIWLIAVSFFGLFGSFINFFYTGRITHHFSVFPVIAALCFVAIPDKGIRRLLWYSFWGIMLAYIYSIRFSISFLGIGAGILICQLLANDISLKRFFINIFNMTASVGIASIAAYQELRLIIDSLKSQGLAFLMLQRDPSYGADGELLDRILKWSGFIATYESRNIFLWPQQALLYALIMFVFLLALIQAVRGFSRSPAYTGIFFYSVISAAALFISQNYYVAWKLSLYWPIYMLLGCVAFAIGLVEEKGKRKKISGYIVIFILLFYIAISARQFNFFYDLVNQRYTKIDVATNNMEIAVQKYYDKCSECDRKIFGYDLSPERHLLLREIFRDYPWQPVRGKELNFEYDIHLKSTINFSDYKYGLLLYSETYKCGFIDFNGNNELIYDNYPNKIYGPKSSLVEFSGGFEPRIYVQYNPELRCPVYGEEMTEESAKILFANNGSHQWLDFNIRVYSPASLSSKAEIPLLIRSGKTSSKPYIKLLDTGEGFADYLVKFSDLDKMRILEIDLIKRNEASRVLVTNSKWGYFSNK